ncbi:uncharacterized protein PHACADRAFT_260525 [Phanerochaete carnosa HHB-10118-sp]|uniref:F-box domain-containing protein n=1 Tax=Phanerochaete carnosa (strain HHB-10118-sp) TaxID=650164 RepID=K5W065_PHACS|nr:uncharacterized protein PHACADRAFT_260525 [Phanerochaete carnosa HHB-10118-sp]EKM52269.1 hypothetical protein PHACADRAFT_260525 [Phanerochaete carnosa HHB-10118-sp]
MSMSGTLEFTKLSYDDFDLIFSILREEHIAEWDALKRSGSAYRTLCICASASRTLRDLAQRHLFRDLIFTYGPVITRDCDKLSHGRGCAGCGCSCHSEEAPARKELSTFHQYLVDSPHVRQHARSLRLRASPLGVRAKETVEAASLSQVLAQLPKLDTLHLEDISLRSTPQTSSPDSSSQLVKIPALERLTLAFQHAGIGSQDSVFKILAQCDSVRHLRLLGMHSWNGRTLPDPATAATLRPYLGVKSVEIETYGPLFGKIFTYLAAATRAGLRSIRVNGVTNPAVASGLQTLLDATNTQLEHFACGDMTAGRRTFREIQAMLSNVHGPNLSRCTSLASIEITLHLGCNSLGLELQYIINPMLLSLRVGSRGKLRQIMLKSAVREGLLSDLQHTSVSPWLSKLDEILLTLYDRRGVAEVLVRLDDVAGRLDLAAKNRNAIWDSLPRVASSGILRILTV